MDADVQPVSAARRWGGRILSGLAAALLFVDAVMKLFQPEPIVKATVELGFSEAVILPLGLVLLGSVLLYAVPRTAVLGAVLLTGYLGGASATHVRAGHGAFEVLFPVAFGVFLWAGLVLRDPRLARQFFRRT